MTKIDLVDAMVAAANDRSGNECGHKLVLVAIRLTSALEYSQR